MKRILITGITGYIGSCLAHALLSEYEIFGLVRLPLNEEYLSDIKDKLTLFPYDGSQESVLEAIQTCQPKIVYHLATFYTGAHNTQVVPQMIESNIRYGAFILEAMATCQCQKIIYASTIMSHFEGEIYRPLNFYAATKQAFSDLLEYYTDARILKAVTLVLSDTYGPGDHRAKILNIIKKAIKQSESIALTDGLQDYDAVYIDDVVQAFVQAAEQCDISDSWNQIFQVGSEDIRSLRETVELLVQISGQSLCADWGKKPHHEREIKKALQCFPPVPGWKQKIGLEEGLKRFWQF